MKKKSFKRHSKVIVKCAICHKKFEVHYYRAKKYTNFYCSDECLGKSRSIRFSESNKGKNNPIYKHGKYSKDYQNQCIDCGKEVSPLSERCYDCAGKNATGENAYNWKGNKAIHRLVRYCIDCGKEITTYNKTGLCPSCSKKDERNPSYKEGISRLPYSQNFTSELKESIRQRDNYKCQNCGITEEEYLIIQGINLSIHHIDYDKMNCEETNLITVCNQCNLRANFNRDYWYAFYKYKIENQIIKEKVNEQNN
jgi:5-methylcytosine-specific restriction endonuclease McrA